MKYACISRWRDSFPVTLMCRVLAVSRAGYYAWCQRPPSARAQQDAALTRAIRRLHDGSRQTYGSPRIHRALQAEAVHCGRKRVVRLMQTAGLCARRARRYRGTTRPDPAQLVAANRLARHFTPPALNTVWVADVTACWTGEGWLYLAVLLDLGSRRVIGWRCGPAADQALTLAALQQALRARRPAAGLLHHSDRGVQYTGRAYQACLAAHGVEASMSRAGNCWDNAVAESFFATLKTELVTAAPWPTRADARQAIGHYIDHWYNRRRLHSTLHYVSPAEYERQRRAA